MRGSVIIILVHQTVFHGVFFVKNISLRRRLGMPIRGRNREATLSVGFAMIHFMVLKEEKHLTALHGEKYRQYQKKVPRYFII
jgi:protein-S-isoprenylcysteine O-methyltransferase Ste14